MLDMWEWQRVNQGKFDLGTSEFQETLDVRRSWWADQVLAEGALPELMKTGSSSEVVQALHELIEEKGGAPC